MKITAQELISMIYLLKEQFKRQNGPKQRKKSRSSGDFLFFIMNAFQNYDKTSVTDDSGSQKVVVLGTRKEWSLGPFSYYHQFNSV